MERKVRIGGFIEWPLYLTGIRTKKESRKGQQEGAWVAIMVVGKPL